MRPKLRLVPALTEPAKFSPRPNLAFREEPKGYRIALVSTHVRAVFGEGIHANVVRFSPEDIEVEADAVAHETGERTTVMLHLGGESLGPLQVECEEGAASTRRDAVARFRFTDLALEEGRRLVRVGRELVRVGLASTRPTPLVSEQDVAPSELREVAELVVANRCHGVLRTMGGATRQVRAVALLETSEAIAWEYTEGPANPPFVIEVTGHNHVYRFEADDALSGDRRLVTPLRSLRVQRQRRRAFRRAELRADDTVSFRHPAWPEHRVSAKIRDFSWDGIALVCNPEEDAIYPGLVIDGLELQAPDGPIVLRGIVRATVGNPEGNDSVCGLQVVPAGAHDEVRWLDYVMERLHVSTSAGDGWSEQSWDLFERSGYFHLSDKQPKDFVTQKRSFLRASRKLSDAPRVGTQVVWPSERGIEASLSMIKPFSSAWFLHHMAKRPDGEPKGTSGRQILRDVYLRAYEFVQTDPDLAWLSGYAEAHVRWSQFAHFDFAEQFVPLGEACNFPFRLLEGSCETRHEAAPEGVEIGPAEPEDVRQILAVLGLTRPPAYLQALDFVPARFDLGATTRAWRAAGLSRQRATIVARRQGRAVLAAVLETAEDGTNLFRILDGVRLVAMTEEPVAALSPFMLDVARAWYRARGKSKFVHYLEDPTQDFASWGLADLGEGIVWALASKHLPTFLEHIYRVTSPKSETRQLRAPDAVRKTS
jgi:hypothetical protein